MNNRPTIRLALEPILKAKGITQREAAKRTGLSENSISRLTSGVRHVRLDTLSALCGGLDISPADLFEIDQPEKAAH